jgi:hypothetical protein
MQVALALLFSDFCLDDHVLPITCCAA